jgi:hypothetical protein
MMRVLENHAWPYAVSVWLYAGQASSFNSSEDSGSVRLAEL